MKKYLLVLVFITSQLFALEGIQFKIKQYEDSIKFAIKKPARVQGVQKRKNSKQNHITQITIESNGKIIYDIFTNQNLPANSRFKFRFKNNIYDDMIKVTIIDNNNQKIQKIFSKNDIFNKIAIWEVVDSEVEKNSSLY